MDENYNIKKIVYCMCVCVCVSGIGMSENMSAKIRKIMMCQGWVIDIFSIMIGHVMSSYMT